MKNVVVNLQFDDGQKPFRLWFVFQSRYDLSGLAAALSAGEIVVGTRIDIRSVGPHSKQEARRREFALGKAMLSHIESCDWDILPADAGAPALGGR